jgi:hypothetical protein
MPGTHAAPTGVGPVPYTRLDRSEATGWVAWLLFAAAMLVLLGSFQAIIGIVALFDDGFYLVHHDGQLIPIDYTTWGWIHIGLAAIALGTGVGLLVGVLWARVVAVVLAGVNVIVGFAFLAAYPWWAVALIAFSVITMYAILVHGHEVADAYDS